MVYHSDSVRLCLVRMLLLDLRRTIFSKLYILCSSAYKRYGFMTIKSPKQYKNKEGVKTSTIVFTQTIDFYYSELTP